MQLGMIGLGRMGANDAALGRADACAGGVPAAMNR